jgi:hypothetical protein
LKNLIWVFPFLFLAGAPIGVEPQVYTSHAVQVMSGMAHVPRSVPASPEALADRAKLRVLEQVLLSKNDNDPRLDREFGDLTEGAKELFRERYRSLAPESRNERGTIVFLLGRNLSSVRDFAFFETVFQESPCLSLGDCEREAESQFDDGGAGSLAVSLAYPQLVALSSVERELGRGRLGEFRGLVEAAAQSPVPMVAEKAQQLLERL